MQFGAYTFVETRRDPAPASRSMSTRAFADVIEQIELADRVGLDVFGLGEHHRPDYAVSAPAVALAAAAARTKRIRLTSAVTVLSSDDPVRVYQQFATLDLISKGRAEIMAGRGSFIESFPLFGYDLDDYDELFAEKLDLLLAIRAKPQVTWRGRHRPPLDRPGRLSAGAATAAAGLDRLGRHAAIGRARRRAWPAFGDCDHRRVAGAIWTARGALSRGGSPRRRRARQAQGRNQRPWLPRRHDQSRGRGVLRALCRGDEPHRARARLAAPVACAIRSGPRPARTSDRRNAGRGHRRNPRSARGLSTTTAISCRWPSAHSRKTPFCVRSSFWELWLRREYERNLRSGRSRLDGGQSQKSPSVSAGADDRHVRGIGQATFRLPAEERPVRLSATIS